MTRLIAFVAVLAALFGAVASSSSSSTHSTKDVKLTLVAYSTPREAYAKIIEAFQKTPAGRGVSFDQSYGASGEQSRAVEQGLPADVIAFSLAPDITRLISKGLVAKHWNKDAYRGMVTRSVVVFALRDGNPKKIRRWSDLTRSGIEVLTPNPFTSGGARWNVMAAYGAQIRLGKTHKQAVSYLENLFRHVPVQDKSARESLQTFLGGKGDALLAYENEALFAQKKGQAVQFVIPKETILIENPVAVVKTSKHKPEARAFVRFLRSPAAQRIYAENGYRPVLKSVAKQYKFPSRPGLFKIDRFGGWPKVDKQFFDPTKGIMAQIQRKVGQG
jgi:sulfate/thiosulfate transport system substrate-binding protein